jgi:hypothetical protein
MDLNALIKSFISLHTSARQRTTEWYKNKKTTVGGSELAAIIGWNRYSSFAKVLGSKIGIIKWDGNSIPCCWGTFFEAISERLIELDMDTTIYGTDIHIQGNWLGYNDHANSPDGYCVVKLKQDGNLLLRGEKDDNVKKSVVLLEFKSPYNRLPTGSVPKYYLPQVWSGLTLSPIAHFGIYVDVVYRICSLDDLGPSKNYNLNYHTYDKQEWKDFPVAWGVSFIYAPTGNKTALQLLQSYFGIDLIEPIDFGDCTNHLFDVMLYNTVNGDFIVKHQDPQFNSIQLDMINSIDGYFLLGILPWKVMKIHYIPVQRNPGFLDGCKDQMQKLITTAADILSSENVQSAYYDFCKELQAEKFQGFSDEQVQDYFDTI